MDEPSSSTPLLREGPDSNGVNEPDSSNGLVHDADANADARPTRASSSSTPTASLDLPSLLPLSHSHPLLTSSQFNVDAFLLTRIHIPLDELRAELREYLGVLREELVQLINDDYEEFISLGTGLRGEEERLKRLHAPLGSVREEIEIVRNVLRDHQDALQEKLDQRAALREEKALLDLLQRLFETLSRAERLALPSADSEGSKHVLRLAGEYTQLVYLCDKAQGEGCEVVEPIVPRLAAIKASLSKDLAAMLQKTLVERDSIQLRQCLKTYEVIEGWSEAEEVVRAEIKQFCKLSITASALSQATSPLVPETPSITTNPFELDRLPEKEPLATLYNHILAQMLHYTDLFKISTDISGNFDFFSRVVWPEISNAIVEKLGHVIFAAGRPDELHKYYTLTHDFLNLFEQCAPTIDSVVSMRSGPAYDSFEKRWQLPVYFQLRWKEIVTSFESGMATAATTPTAPWELGQTAATWKSIELCWSKEVYIPELAFRFWRLTLQLIARYNAWLQTTLASTAPSEDDRSKDDQALRFAAAAVMDIGTLTERLKGIEPVQSLESDLGINLSTKPFEDRIVDILVRQSSETLKLVRSVASQFRTAPNRGSDNLQPSHFVPNILRPLHVFLDARPTLKSTYGPQWARRILDEVVTGYAAILTSVRKTEDLLRRHRKNKKNTFSLFGSSSAAAGGDGAEDDERFHKQMKADIDALAADAKTLDVDVQMDLSSWAELSDVMDRPVE